MACRVHISDLHIDKRIQKIQIGLIDIPTGKETILFREDVPAKITSFDDD